MTAICASHYRNPLNDYVGKKHHHKNRFRQRQSSRSAFYQPGLRVIESRGDGDDKTCRESDHQSQSQSQQQPQSSLQQSQDWGFRPSALQYEDYGDMSVSEIVDCYVRDNERAEQEGVSIPTRPTLAKRNNHLHVRDALFSASSSSTRTRPQQQQQQKSTLRCLQWNIQAFLSPKDERNMHTITAGIIRSICETDSDVLVLNEIHWREMDSYFHFLHNSCLTTTQQAIRSSQALLEEVLRLRGYHSIRVSNHGDTPTLMATRQRVTRQTEVVLSKNRSALCLLLEVPGNGRCWVVGTHLDAFSDANRRAEISRLLQEDFADAPILICGDFNQQRARDYTPNEWKQIRSSASIRGVPLDDGVADLLETKGFRCILDDVRQSSDSTHQNSTTKTTNVRCNWDQAQPPPSTHWSGTTIDYTYYSNHKTSATTAIAPHGVYIGSAGFSDHRMTVTDWTLTTTCSVPNNTNNANHEPRHIDKTFFFHHLPAGRHRSWLYSYKNRDPMEHKRSGRK